MRLLFCSVVAVLLTQFGISQHSLQLVPWPAEVKQSEGSYLLKDRASFASDFPKEGQQRLFQYLKNELKRSGITLIPATKGQVSDIRVQLRRIAGGDKPTYKLNVAKNGIVIEANTEESAFHAFQTLIQLLPLETGARKNIAQVSIVDYPRFSYRGMHLDVSRHFFPVSFVKKYIDYLAYHKFNQFHWHLTEDQGWRIEIKKYPELTNIGAWRNGTIVGRYPGTGSDNRRYGGFYTQAEIREVVKYAKERYIDVIPEIEMPGHGSAAIAAYPWLSCFPAKPTFIPANMISNESIDEQKNGRIKLVQETWGVFDDVFCAGNDSTFGFLQNVIDEVVKLFPSKYFHLGADECPKTHWKQCPRCQKRIKDLGLKDEHELQSYFVQRIEKYINSKGKTLIGWDEILEGGLAPNAVVMSWRGETGGIEAAKQKHQVIMTPGNPVYFDHTQSQNEDSVTIGGYNPLEKVYAYEPIPKELNEEEAKYVLGAQANLWTEYIKNTRKVEYMIFPRMSALSEVLWSPKANRNWEHFEKRLPGQIKRYENWKANYSKAYYDLKATTTARAGYTDGLVWNLETKIPNSKIYYKMQGAQDGMGEFKAYTGPVEFKWPTMVAMAVDTVNKISTEITQGFNFNKATGKMISLKEEASKNYPGDGAFTLVNGIQNTKGLARSREFLGFNGGNLEAIIDLGKETELYEVVIHTLEQQGSWIYSPSAFDISRSADGQSFSPFNTGISITKSADKDKVTLKLASPVTARYIKVIVMNHGVIAQGSPGAGNKAWLFVDEIEVN